VSAPYYEDEWVTLYHGDCREVTAWLDADVLVTDPPYGRAWQSGSGMTNSEGRGQGSRPHGGIAGDKDTEVRDFALFLWGERRAVVFGDPLISAPRGARQALVYAKPMDAGIKGAHARFRRDVELIYLVGPWDVGVGGRSSVLTTSALVAGPRGLSVRYEHPHAKPVDLLEGLLAHIFPYHGNAAEAAASAERTVIADPFAGSGSALIAARHRGHRAIGVELEERYCEIAAKRLAQDTLFGGVA
jgi:site-specific DNA-methyltransferase (adenine-specific)